MAKHILVLCGATLFVWLVISCANVASASAVPAVAAAPAVVTAQSHQVVARNYNRLYVPTGYVPMSYVPAVAAYPSYTTAANTHPTAYRYALGYGGYAYYPAYGYAYGYGTVVPTITTLWRR